MKLAFIFLAFILITSEDTVLSQGMSYWTKWLDRDNADGYGDEETYRDFPAEPCRNVEGFTPVQAQCRIKRNRTPWYTAGKYIERRYACTAKGIICSNEAQGCGKHEICCPDYEIRFLCYKERSVTYLTNWLDRDDPTSTGDDETYNSFSTKPCREENGFQPVEAHCRIKQTRRPWYTVKKVIEDCHACTAEGMRCLNNQQSPCSKNQVCCPDYEIQFLCHKASKPNVYPSCSDAVQKTRNMSMLSPDHRGKPAVRGNDNVMVIPDGKKLQIWSLMSTTNDQYVCMTNDPVDNITSSFVVKATGLATDSSSITVTFLRSGLTKYKLKFTKDGDNYYMRGTKTGIEAGTSKQNKDPQMWKIYRMESPNMEYYAIGLFKENKSNAMLFLSSDGKGNMKLKPSNSASYPPPAQNVFIDPTLLFRLVEPDGSAY